MTDQTDPACGQFLTFSSIEFMIARHLDEHCLRIDTPTRYLLAQLRDLAADHAARLRADLARPRGDLGGHRGPGLGPMVHCDGARQAAL